MGTFFSREIKPEKSGEKLGPSNSTYADKIIYLKFKIHVFYELALADK
jgi:hypothetical protein